MKLPMDGAIDSDLHPTLPGVPALLPYLDDYWRDQFANRRIDRLPSNPPPSAAASRWRCMRILRARQPLPAQGRRALPRHDRGAGPVRCARRIPPVPPGRVHPLPVAALGVRHPHRQSWCDPKSVRAHHFDVAVEPGSRLLGGPYNAETFPVSVEEDYLVIDL